MKPSVLVIADFPNWAYYEIQQFIKNNLSNEFDIYCDYLIFNSIKKTRHPLKRIKLNIDKFKYQQTKKDGSYDIVLYLGFYFDKLMNVNWTTKKVIKGIYTENFPPKNATNIYSFKDFSNKYLVKTDAIVCGSYQIKEKYSSINITSKVANMVLDKELFKRKTPKQKNLSENFIIGWTGNPNRVFKGFYTHIVPAVEKAKRIYPKIKLKTRFSGPMETLPYFYNDIDIIIIASDADAGPSLFGEASLMEVPAISTDIGWPHEVIKNNINGFIVNKEINAITSKILELYENRELLFNFSKRIREDYLKFYDKEKMVNDWKKLFYEVLKS